MPNSSAPIKNLLKINLLIKKGAGVPFQTRLLKWVLTSGRFIVIFVEMIVISAFVYRYKLDSDLAALQDDITQQTAYVKSLKSDEDTIRLFQLQLAKIQTVKANTPNLGTIFSKIASLTPQSIRLNNISIDGTQSLDKITVVISGNTPSNTDLSNYIRSLQNDGYFSDVTLSNISFDANTTFNITATVLSKGAKS